MSGIEGLGRLATLGQHGVDAVGLSRVLDHIGRHVDRDNVLAARAVLLYEVDELRELVRAEQTEHMVAVPRPAPGGTVEVTVPDRTQARIDALTRAADRLASAAADYGITEEPRPVMRRR